MPTHDETGAFLRDYESLAPEQQDRFDSKREEFVADLIAMERGRRQGFRRGLRVKRVRGASGLFEMTWAPDGRAGGRSSQWASRSSSASATSCGTASAITASCHDAASHSPGESGRRWAAARSRSRLGDLPHELPATAAERCRGRRRAARLCMFVLRSAPSRGRTSLGRSPIRVISNNGSCLPKGLMRTPRRGCRPCR